MDRPVKAAKREDPARCGVFLLQIQTRCFMVCDGCNQFNK
jgi:hypothetical protein